MMSVPEQANLAAKLNEITEHWRPRVVGELNGQAVKVVKPQGEFVWHNHEHEDELFLVLAGHLRIDFRDGSKELDRASGRAQHRQRDPLDVNRPP